MKILLQNSLFFPDVIGGAERSTWLLARELSAQGHEVDVICTSGRIASDERERSVEGFRGRIYEGPAEGTLDLFEREGEAPSILQKAVHHVRAVRSSRWEGRLESLLRELRPDVLHTNNLMGMGDAPWRAARAAGIPIVHTARDYGLLCARTTLWRSRGEECVAPPIPCRVLAHQKLREADAVDALVAASQHVLDQHVSRFPRARALVIPNAYTGEWPDPVPPLPHGETRALYLGQLEEHKGVRLLLRAIEALWADGVRIAVDVAGRGELSDEVARFAAASGGRCRALGHVDEAGKRAAFARSSFLVFPSLWKEPFGLSVIEAFVFGRPVVVVRGSGGPEELVGDRGRGLIAHASEQSLVSALRSYVEDRALLADHAKAAQDAARQYRSEVTVSAYLEAYEAAGAR